MSMCSLGMSEEFRKDKVAVNTLWPRTGYYLFNKPVLYTICYTRLLGYYTNL